MKMEIRTAYGEALKELGAKNDRVVVLEADLGSSTKSALFGKEFPKRYFNVGIAELNMVAMSAGMASAGLIPFVNTFAVFLALRGGDPIQSLISYDRLNVKLAGAYGGMSDSYDGASHHAITDIAQLRAMPNMTVVSVCDGVETKKAVNAVANLDGPVYLRLSRASTEVIYDESYNFQIGRGHRLTQGSDVTIAATGCMVQVALAAAELLKNEGISACVANIHTIKPIDTELLSICARETGAIVTAEEHNIYGGFGSAVLEAVARTCPVPVEMVGIEDCFAESGDYDQLLDKYGLNAAHIAAKAKRAISRK